MFYFHPYLGKWSNLTNIFQKGWNHHLVKNSLNWLWLSELGHQTGNNSQGLGIASIAWPLREKSKRVRFAQFGTQQFPCQACRRQNTSSLCSWSSIRLANTTGIGSWFYHFNQVQTSHGKQLEGDDPTTNLVGHEPCIPNGLFMLCQQVLFGWTLCAPRQHLDTHQEPERLVEQTWMSLPQAAWD